VVYSIDGTVVATHNVDLSDNLRPLVSDRNAGGDSLQVDWVRMTPYLSPCSFESRVLDASQSVNWQTMSWNADTPTGTGVILTYRTGDTLNPDDGSWTEYMAAGSSPAMLAGNSRYIQYRAGLETSDEARRLLWMTAPQPMKTWL